MTETRDGDLKFGEVTFASSFIGAFFFSWKRALPMNHVLFAFSLPYFCVMTLSSLFMKASMSAGVIPMAAAAVR